VTDVERVIHVIVNGIQLHLETRPGLFSPARPDPGTLAMLSVTKLAPREKVLDLGCGYGLVGIYMAKLCGAQQVVMSDDDPLALEVARRNAVSNGLEDIRVLLSDGFEQIADEDFTLIMANPPYHADFSVPKGFIEGARRHLTVGGRLVMVVKRVTWYRNKMQSVFGGVRVTLADGYAVLESEKRSGSPRAKPIKATTKKHSRRVQASAARKRH
jgi:16S rRNA (guanine1207-N2)-methyltransferase